MHACSVVIRVQATQDCGYAEYSYSGLFRAGEEVEAAEAQRQRAQRLLESGDGQLPGAGAAAATPAGPPPLQVAVQGMRALRGETCRMIAGFDDLVTALRSVAPGAPSNALRLQPHLSRHERRASETQVAGCPGGGGGGGRGGGAPIRAVLSAASPEHGHILL